MKAIQLGQKIKPVAIQRANVADNVQGRAMLLDLNPRVKQIAYDDRVKRAVEVSQEDCIKHRLSPRPTYYFLIARLNTDMQGTVVGSDIIVEYLQLSASTYDKFSTAILEVGGASKMASLLLTKVINKDYGYVSPMPSAKIDFPNEALEKVKALRGNKAAIEGMWEMVNIATSIDIVEYEKLLVEKQLMAPEQAIEPIAPINQQKAIQSDNSFGKDFDSGFESIETTDAVEVTDSDFGTSSDFGSDTGF